MSNDPGWAPLVGVCGLAGAGKDEVAKVFVQHGWRRKALADPMREMLLDLDPLVAGGNGEQEKARGLRVSRVVNHYGWDIAKRNYPEVRYLLQRLGTELVRKHMGEDYWIERLLAEWVADRMHPTVVPDVRFPNEAARLKEEGGLLIRVHRDGLSAMDHPSEQYVETLPADVTLFNVGTLDELQVAVATLMDHFDLFSFEALASANHASV